MATPLKVRGIGTSKHKTNKYVLKVLYFPAISNKGQRVIAYIHCKHHLVDNLRANILIGNDIIGTKSITIDIANGKVYFLKCKAIVPITAKQHGQLIRRALHSINCVTIHPQSQAFISTNSLSLSLDRDFYFEPAQ